jgi:hypothetical protein
MTASPLWRGLLARPTTSTELDAMQRPVLLRMTTDDFMDDLVALLRKHPDQLATLEATPRSYRARPPAAGPSYVPPIDHLKLFQPVHGHFNLVAATLACRVVGLPDKAVDAGAEESVSFVMRRQQGTTELAWTGQGWSAVDNPTELADDEELLPMFPMESAGPDRTRRVFVGMVPTSSTASSKSRLGSLLTPEPGQSGPVLPDPRPTEIEVKVSDTLAALKDPNVPTDNSTLGRVARVEASQFLLLDLVDILARHVPALWTAIQQGVEPTATALRRAYRLLENTTAGGSPALSWRQALVEAYAQRERIWGDNDQAPSLGIDLRSTSMVPDTLRDRLVATLPSASGTPAGDVPEGFESPKIDPRPGVRYVVRCAYRRPMCGPPHPDVVSAPTVPFGIAPFFDPDAPARQVHIPMPLDTSVAGLRKAPKNVRIMVSRELQSQVQRVTDLNKTLKGELNKGEPLDLGLICSFSLPIITICALVLLMIFVVVLNLVFWWLPFFKICFPVPVKGKS